MIGLHVNWPSMQRVSLEKSVIELNNLLFSFLFIAIFSRFEKLLHFQNASQQFQI